MKKLITIIALALSIAGVSAQQGTFYLGTTGMNPFGGESSEGFSATPMTGFTTGKTNVYFEDEDPITGLPTVISSEVTTTNFGLAPEVGYFISDNFAVGLGVFFTYSQIKPKGGDKTNLTTFGFNPYARYYFLNKGDFRMYGQFDITYASSKMKDADDSLNAFGIGVKPGVSYNVSDNFAINATFGNLGYSQTKFGDADPDSQFGLTVDMSTLNFGFTVAF